MRIQVISDLHLEWHKDYGKSFIRHMPNDSIDILCVAGDLTAYPQVEWVLKELCNKFSKVIYILGNHEHYGSDFISINQMMERLSKSIPNLYWLENKREIINGIPFIGATLWFAETPDTHKHKHHLSDFGEIRNFEPVVYHKSDESAKFLANNILKGDIVITHHMPSYNSVVPQFKNSVLNSYFVRDMEQEIVTLEPAIWIHGHTHISMNYIFHNTKVICNPFGYAGYEENQQFKDLLIIEV
jgi:Icc-related predicted phosphoesterase